MEKKELLYKSSHINYYRFGNGSQAVICFHGYGETAQSFSFLEKYAGDQFSFYAIDLPFHGETKWNEGLSFDRPDLQQIVHDILLENQTPNGGIETSHPKIYVMGYSLGGRVALSLYQSWPDSIDRLELLAPDGLKVNFWYWLATQTWPGYHLFHYTMKYPGWFFAFLRALNFFKVVNPSVYKFVNYYIGNKAARLELFERWTSMRKLKPDLPRIRSLITKNKTEVRLLYGKHDRIILPVRGEHFIKGIEEYCTLTILNAGHQLLHEKYANEIVRQLKTNTVA